MNEIKNTLVTWSCFFLEYYIFLENFVSLEGAIPHNVLYYQQLSLTHYQVICYAQNYFE